MYEIIEKLGPKLEENTPSLEQYLSALWQVVSAGQEKLLSDKQVVEWLGAAFEQRSPEFRQEWLSVQKGDLYLRDSYDDATFEDWENLILFQIADLKRMDETGMLDDEYKFFGIDSPSGERWYNFDPSGYLKCAATAVFGQDNDSDREGEPFSWGDFIQFLICGQIYE